MTCVAYCQPDGAYRAEPHENQSYLKHILTSPAHYLSAKKRKFFTTPFMEMGSALHCKVLEGDDAFDSRYIRKPDKISLTTKEGKEWKASVGRKTVLSNSDKDSIWDSVHGMTDTLRKLKWFDGSQDDYRKFNELSIYWESDGVNCKARLDRVVFEDDRCLVLDLKTTDCIDTDTFCKKVTGGMNYLFQAAWYVEAAEKAFKMPAEFIFVAIERSAPWSVRIFDLSSEMIEEGKAQTTHARKLLVDCLAKDSWPTKQIEKATLDLPKWYQSPLQFEQEVFKPIF